MKAHRPIPVLLLLMVSMSFHAQKPIAIMEDSVKFNNGNCPGLSVTIPEVSFERTQKNWIRVLQSGTKSNVVTEIGELSIFGALIRDISSNPLNVYSKLINQDSMVVLKACFETKKDVYIEKVNGDAQLIAAREFLKQFAKDQYVDFVKDEWQAEDKKMKDLQNDLNNLQNEKSRMEKSIQTNEKSIRDEKDHIAAQKIELNKMEAEILTANEQLGIMEAGAAKEEKAGYIKELEKRRKKIQNDIESSQNKITRAGDEISEANRKIPENITRQQEAQQKVDQQQPVVQKYTDKLNKVKGY